MALQETATTTPGGAKKGEVLDGGQLVQIIDYDGDIVADIGAWMKKQHVADAGFNYNVITILGSQSSGKSSLMNALFDCNFQVMDHIHGHSQTTKGIWLGRDGLSAAADSRARPCLVVDVEGIDSRERGEDRQTFEHRSALFALALADCLVINVWYHSLGNFTASGYGLLKTVMEVNLELFAQERNTPRTILLFAVRDWAEVMTPLETVKQKIAREYVERIWNEIQKPPAFEHSMPYDLFDFQVFGLAHKFMNPQQFDKDVEVLRQTWMTSLRPARYSRQVPADGFAHYATSIWEVIKQQEHLNIPNQKEMLAIYRCQEIKAQALAGLTAEVAAMNAKIQKKEVDAPQFSQWLSVLAASAVAEYLEHASRYQADVCRRVKAELLEGLTAVAQPLVDSLLSNTRDSIARDFSEELMSSFAAAKGDPPITLSGQAVLDAWSGYNEGTAELLRDAQRRFLAVADACGAKLPDGSQLAFATDLVLDGMTRVLSKDVEAVREKQQAQLVALLQKTCDGKLVGVSDSLASREFSPEKFWELCRVKTAAAAEECFTLFRKAHIGLASSSSSSTSLTSPRKRARETSEEDSFRVQCRVLALMQLRKQMQSIVANVHVFILDRFQTFFSYDPNDQPRQWEALTPDQLQKIFVEAKEQALVLVPTFACMRLHPLSISTASLLPAAAESSPADFLDRPEFSAAEREELAPLPAQFFAPLLDALQAQTARQKTLRQMQQMCRDAQALQQGKGTVSWRSVPLWGWLLLLALGWNELAAVLQFLTGNWIFFPIFLVALAAAAAAVFTGNVQVALASLQHFLLLAKTVALPVARELLVKALNAVDPQPAAPRRTERDSRGSPRGAAATVEELKRPQDLPPKTGAASSPPRAEASPRSRESESM
ncbi:root hair defective 3 gtp-binding protein (rhd3) protein [Besnoitia besnoiti]|uniref:Protein SEY1 homolog n=1 Tax=Besnoitia besnoiti TaxID=94643 RepID=A0A2A9M6N4_BESBE|nr:root hair defective 3 gtp-binding protein (rhd3) protein [Besnoitia besnoiti]PFH31042.1 root hair defective 3 gtp-binding protein (rhd3) protein [Besnoitia besnoiti]